MSISLPWNKINDFLLNCSSVRDPKAYSCQILNHIHSLIPFDQARLYFITDNGTVYDEYLLGVDPQIVREYHDYYSQVDNGAYSLSRRVHNFQKCYPKVEESIYSWDKYDHQQEFFKDYIRPHQIRHSFGLGLRDTHNTLKCLISLDRICDIAYSNYDIEIMRCIRPHLDNFHQVFYVNLAGNESADNALSFEKFPLTPRELEISALLKHGVTPQKISQKLSISTKTVNKHIANMHAKLNVSSRQELIVKLYNL